MNANASLLDPPTENSGDEDTPQSEATQVAPVPGSTSPGRPRFVRAVGALAALALVGGIAGAYQVGVRAKRPPSFTIGGDFVDPSAFPAPGVDGRGYPYGNVLGEPTPTGDTTATTAAAGGAAPSGATATTAAPATTPTPSDLLVNPRIPATGTYTYAVSGSEAVTGFGSRGYPAQATIVVHEDPSIQADELVHDLKFSDQHEERSVVKYGPKGLAFTYEGGAITFGPGTQTSQGFYNPAMVQIPYPLQAGASATGTTPVRDQADNVSRTEVWTAKVVGQEAIDVLGQRRTTWVVDLQRNTTPGGQEQVDRFKRYWFDPELGVWVKWTERFHAARNMIVAFTYDTEYTATLSGFTAG